MLYVNQISAVSSLRMRLIEERATGPRTNPNTTADRKDSWSLLIWSRREILKKYFTFLSNLKIRISKNRWPRRYAPLIMKSKSKHSDFAASAHSFFCCLIFWTVLRSLNVVDCFALFPNYWVVFAEKRWHGKNLFIICLSEFIINMLHLALPISDAVLATRTLDFMTILRLFLTYVRQAEDRVNLIFSIQITVPADFLVVVAGLVPFWTLSRTLTVHHYYWF